MAAWRSVKLSHSVTTIQGGYSAQPQPAPCIEYGEGGVFHKFVALDKNAKWFLKGVGGAKACKGDLKPVRVLQIIRDTFNKAPVTAVAELEHPAAVAEEVDPMDAMEALSEQQVVTPQKKGADRALVKALKMPTKPLYEASGGIEGDEGDETTIYVYRKHDPSVKGHEHGCTFHLRSDCLDWLLSYAAAELSCQGVGQTRPSQLEANCTAVADLNLEWDFNARAWRAQFVAGPLQGASCHMSVQDFNKHHWAKLKAQETVEGFLAHASANARKAAVQVWVQMWGEAALRNETDVFNAEWQNANEKCTPRKKKKRSRAHSEELFDEESDDPANKLFAGEILGSPADE